MPLIVACLTGMRSDRFWSERSPAIAIKLSGKDGIIREIQYPAVCVVAPLRLATDRQCEGQTPEDFDVSFVNKDGYHPTPCCPVSSV